MPETSPSLLYHRDTQQVPWPIAMPICLKSHYGFYLYSLGKGYMIPEIVTLLGAGGCQLKTTWILNVSYSSHSSKGSWIFVASLSFWPFLCWAIHALLAFSMSNLSHGFLTYLLNLTHFCQCFMSYSFSIIYISHISGVSSILLFSCLLEQSWIFSKNTANTHYSVDCLYADSLKF